MAPKGVQKGVLSPTEPCLRFPDLVNSDNSDPNLIKSDQNRLNLTFQGSRGPRYPGFDPIYRSLDPKSLATHA